MAIEQEILDHDPQEDHDDYGKEMDDLLFSAVAVTLIGEEIKGKGGDDEDADGKEAKAHDSHNTDEEAH